MKIIEAIPFLNFVFTSSNAELFQAMVYGSNHDDVFSLQCGLNGSMFLSIEDYPLANGRIAKFTDFKVGNCTVDNGDIQVDEDDTKYDVSFDSATCGTANL